MQIGRVDLLTVLMRQLGSDVSRAKSVLKGPQKWLMENTLGHRYAPCAIIQGAEIGKVPVKRPNQSNRRAEIAERATRSASRFVEWSTEVACNQTSCELTPRLQLPILS